MSTAVLAFDPYIAWLNVLDEDRPLGPYQLLGLASLEPNPAKINAAVLRQRRLLESFRAGANVAAWERVRDELEHAIQQVTNGDLKEILDARIIRKGALARSRKSSGERAPAGPSINCRKCQKTNPSQRKFCGDCGAGLWDGCGACGAEVPVDEKFCGICGANLVDTASAEVEQATARLAEARQLRQKLEYDAAKLVAKKLAKSHDPRFDQAAEEALALIDDVEQELAQHQQEAADALERAQMLISGQAYDGAIAELAEIPPRFLTDEMREVLAEATSKRNEVINLSAEIRTALDNKRTTDLLPKLERLLALKPNHDQAQKLATQLRDRLIVTAKKRIQEYRYADALEALHQVPSFVSTVEVARLVEAATELQWFVDDLRHAPQATQTLQEVAERLLKAAPTHPEAAKFQQQIVACRAKELPADLRRRYHAWAAAPKKTHVDWPVDWLTGSQRLRAPDAAHARLLEDQPGQFFVALGLALQGLDKAPLDLNFLPEEKKFSLKQFSTFMRKKVDRFAWGLDLSASGLKAVKLERHEKDGSLAIVDVVHIRHRKLLSQKDAELDRAALSSETVKEFLATRSLQDARVVVSIPSHKMLGRFFDLPPLELKKVPDAVEYEARHQVPYALDELAWDWSLVSARELAEHEAPRRVVVVAGRDYHLEERVANLKEVGIEPHVVTTDAVALHNFLLHEFFTQAANEGAGEISHDAVVLLDVGAECTNMVIASPSVHWFRSLTIGGDHLTEPLVKQFKLTYAQAELLKRETFRARRLSQLYAVIDPLLETLSTEINRSLDTFQQLYPDQTLSRIYGSGGGFLLHGMWKKLRSGK